MGSAASAVDRAGHPAPQRANASLIALLFGVWGGPIAWSVQLCVNYALSSHACFPDGAPLHDPLWAWNWPALLAINIAAMLISLWAAAVSYRSWNATRDEQPGRMSHALDAGEGRTRFFAICGLMTGLGFFVTTLTDTIVLLGVPQCVG